MNVILTSSLQQDDATLHFSDAFLFTTESRPVLGSTQPPIQWVSGQFPRG